jgi:hypothetical protein
MGGVLGEEGDDGGVGVLHAFDEVVGLGEAGLDGDGVDADVAEAGVAKEGGELVGIAQGEGGFELGAADLDAEGGQVGFLGVDQRGGSRAARTGRGSGGCWPRGRRGARRCRLR